MKIRQGRKNPHTLYLQLGDEPSDSDLCIGLIIDPSICVTIVSAVNDNAAPCPRPGAHMPDDWP